MHSPKLRTKILTCVGLMLCGIAIWTAPATSLVASASGNTDVEVCADFREWVYKLMDGKMYKALLNRTTGQYETDWIYVCDWPPEE